MKHIPILFSTDMVKSLLEGRKTQTRRLNGLEVQNQDPDKWIIGSDPYWSTNGENKNRLACDFITPDEKVMTTAFCPYGIPGDVLWVRETFRKMKSGFDYKTDYEHRINFRWTPNIHMPKSAARIFLQVKTVRVERLQNISDWDAVAEGVRSRLPDNGIAKQDFFDLWTIINGYESLMLNPWVWVVRFECIAKPQNWIK